MVKQILRRKFRQFLVGMTAAAGLMLVAACAPVTSPAEAPDSATPPAAEQAEDTSTLTFATASPWGSYNPFRPVYNYGYSTNIPSLLTHDRLVEGGDGGVIHPGLAERWEVSDDATEYTFYLREGVTWHDGESFTAEDVAATVHFILTQETNINPLYWTDHLEGGRAYYDGESEELPGLEVIDDYTVRFTLAEPFAGWERVAFTDLNILPAHVFKEVEPADVQEQYAEAWFQPELNIGTGPFTFVEAEMDEYIELVRNEDYWRSTPKLERILFRNVGTTDTQFIAFQRGDIDVWNVNPDYVEQAEEVPNSTLHTINRAYIRAFILHYEAPYLADKRVRQALLHGIDRQSLCDDLVSGMCVPYNSFMEPEAWLAPDLNDYEYDPERAQQLLEEAGWDPNQELELVYYYSDPLHRDWMAAIQQQLAQIGVNANLTYLEGAAVGEAQRNCEYDLMYQGWGFADAAKYAPAFIDAERCVGYWDDPEVAELFREAQRTGDEEERREIYNEIQRRVNEELPILPFVKFLGATAVQDDVQGFNEDALWMMHTPWNSGYNNSWNWSIEP